MCISACVYCAYVYMRVFINLFAYISKNVCIYVYTYTLLCRQINAQILLCSSYPESWIQVKGWSRGCRQCKIPWKTHSTMQPTIDRKLSTNDCQNESFEFCRVFSPSFECQLLVSRPKDIRISKLEVYARTINYKPTDKCTA